MLFSVLVPVYNSEKYIKECLDSILGQHFNDYQIIVVDDGSNDRSALICDEYQRLNPEKMVVIHKKNEGVLLTRCRALREASGEYILWVDSDDVIKSELMEDLRAEIVRNNPDVLVYNYELFHDSSKVIHSMKANHMHVFEEHEKEKIYTQMLVGRDMNELWTKCIRRSLVDLDADYSEYAHVRMGDDLFLLFPIMTAAQRIEYLDKSYYRYRIVDTSITHTTSYSSYYSYRSIFERAVSYMKLWRIPEEVCTKAQDQFANRVVACIQNARGVLGKFSDFKTFVEGIRDDERRKPIYSKGKRRLSSPYYQMCYGMFLKGKYMTMYWLIPMVQKVNRINRGFGNGKR